MSGLGVYGWIYGYVYQSALLTPINLRRLHKTINCLHCSRRHICQSTGAPHFSFVFYLSPNNQMHCPRRTWTCCNISRIYTWPTTDYGSLKVDTRQCAIAASCAGDMCLSCWFFWVRVTIRVFFTLSACAGLTTLSKLTKLFVTYQD